MSKTHAAHTAGDLSPAYDRSELRRDALAGVVAGQVAGLMMAVVVMAVFTLFLGKGPLYPVQVIGSFVFGDAALSGFHLPALVAGLLLHQLGPSLVWGGAFGLLAHSLSLRRGAGLAALALGVGVASQIVDVNLVLPFAFRALHGHDIWAEQVPAFWSWAGHVVFGLALLSYPAVRERIERRAA